LRAIVARPSRAKIRLADTPGALHERLASAVEQWIREERFQPGDRLPTHREIARQAGVSIGTVTKALDLLSHRGILRGEVGRGTFVNETRIAAAASRDGVIDLAINGPPHVIAEETFRAAAERAMRNSLALPYGGYAGPRGTAQQP
jgi:DNA-binding transcriptional MocR family regulator